MDRRTQTEVRIGAYTCINSCSDLLLAELEMDDTLRSASLPALSPLSGGSNAIQVFVSFPSICRTLIESTYVLVR